MRPGAEQHPAAPPVCAAGPGVHAGAQHHRQGAHGPTAAPAGESRHPPDGPVLQRVGPTALRSVAEPGATQLGLMKPFVIRLHQILEMAEDIAIDIPHIWLYLAELITPMLPEGGISMGELFRSARTPPPGSLSAVPSAHVLSALCALHLFQGDLKAFNPSGKSWRPAGPDPHVTLQRNGRNPPVPVPVWSRTPGLISLCLICVSRAIKRPGRCGGRQIYGGKTSSLRMRTSTSL